jgi:hypothetical protein
MILRAAAVLAMPLALGAAAAPPKPAQPATEIKDRAALERLLGNSGMSVQWIGWTGAERGKIKPSWQGKTLLLKGEQHAKGAPGFVSVEGRVVRVSKTEFILEGTIVIKDTPDAGRACEKTGDWRFAVTQNRKYWRLREFEWCDDLTDYIDVYF